MHTCMHRTLASSRQVGGQAGMQAGKQAGRQAGRQIERQTGRQRQTSKQAEGVQTGRQAGRRAGRDKQASRANRQRETASVMTEANQCNSHYTVIKPNTKPKCCPRPPIHRNISMRFQCGPKNGPCSGQEIVPKSEWTQRTRARARAHARVHEGVWGLVGMGEDRKKRKGDG